MRAKDFLNEFAPTPDFGDGRRDDGEYLPLTEYADIIEQYLGRGYTREDRQGGAKHLPQISVKFVPRDKSQNGLIIYSFIHPKRGEFATHNTIILHYDEQGIGHGKKGPSSVPKTQKQALQIAQLVNNQKLDEFLDDRERDDDDEISKIVSTADRLLKQGYRVDLGVVGAMGRVYRADFIQTGFAPNGALAFKRKTKTYMRPFLADDDDRYEFEMVAPKHYRIVDVWLEELTESTYQEHQEQLRDFVRWCVKKLKIRKALPRIRFQDAKEGPDQHRTGYYDDNDDIMWIYTGNRNLIDIMRTVAHELTHRKQHEADMVHGDQSYPGSPMEQQADAVAGYLMKLYGREHPEIIE